MSTRPLLLGIDVGGTKIAAGLVSGKTVTAVTAQPTDAKTTPSQVLKNIQRVVSGFPLNRIQAIGVGFPGQIDAQRGAVVASPNFSRHFRNVAVCSALRKKFHKSVLIDNDANCFSLAEATYGAGRGHGVVVGLTVGTGVGGGVVINKKIFHGRNGLAGELGHITIIQNGRRCSCGQRGHVEAYASGGAIVRTYHQLSGKRADSPSIVTLARRGEQDARAALQVAATALSETLANILNALDPDIIVIGGGLSEVRDVLIQPAIARAKALVVYPELTRTPIRVGTLPHAGIVGAALLARS